MRLVVILVILPVLCRAGAIMKLTDPPCPMECTCRDANGKSGQPRRQMAVCTKIPTQGLPNAVTSLTVNGNIGRITRNLMKPIGRKLKELDFSNSKITSIEPGSFDMLTNLETLKLTNNMIKSISRGTFAKNSNLRALYLNQNMLTNVDQADLAKLGHLTELHLDHNQLKTIPKKMPHELTKLVMSNNKLGSNIDPGSDLSQVRKLKELNLGNNPIEMLSLKFFEDISQVQELRLGDKVVLPHGCAQYLRHITFMELVGTVGKTPPNQLSEVTQREIGEMTMLTSLRIENYEIQSLSFLNQLSRLITLNLRNVVVSGAIDLEHIFNSNKHLTTVSFDNSPEIARSFLSNLHIISSLYSLHTVSLRNSGVNHVSRFESPNHFFRLDVSENPLDCDCSFEWLQSPARTLEQVLHAVDKTTCATPDDVTGELLSEVLHKISCPSETEQFINGALPPTTELPQWSETESSNFNQDQFGSEPAVLRESPSMTEGPNVDQTPVVNEGENHDTTRMAVPTVGNGDTNDQGNGANVDPTTTWMPLPGGNGDIEDQGNGGNVDPTENPDTTKMPAPTVGNTDTDDGDSFGISKDDADWSGGNVNPSSTEEPKSHTEGQVKDKKRHKDRDGDSVIYIILGSILIVLVTLGIILTIIYWKVKMGSSKIEPLNDDASKNEEMPSYQKLQAKENTSLIGVKK